MTDKELIKELLENVKKYPNDMELGKELRALLYKYKEIKK